MKLIDRLTIKANAANKSTSFFIIHHKKGEGFTLHYSRWGKNSVAEHTETVHKTRRQLQAHIKKLQAEHPNNHARIIEIKAAKRPSKKEVLHDRET